MTSIAYMKYRSNDWQRRRALYFLLQFKDKPRFYFFAPKVLFFKRSWLPRHFLQRSAEIGFLPPHLKHTLKKSLRCWAICFLAASVIGIYIVFVLQRLFLSLLLIGKLSHNSSHSPIPFVRVRVLQLRGNHDWLLRKKFVIFLTSIITMSEDSFDFKFLVV
jgi:hypothetical protein